MPGGVELGELRGVERRHAEVQRRPEPRDGLQRVARGRSRVEQHGGGAGPQREGHRVAQAVGEEQLGGGEDDVALGDGQHAAAEQLAGHHHVAMAVHGALGPAGRARRVEPEARRGGVGGHRIEHGRRAGEQRAQAARTAVDRQRDRRAAGQRGLDLAGELGRERHGRARRVLDDDAVVGGAQDRVERHRHDAGLDRPPEQVEELRAVLDHHEHALPRREAEPDQRVAAAVDAVGELGVRHVAGRAADRELAAAALRHVAIDERRGDVEARREVKHRGRLRSIDGEARQLHAVYSGARAPIARRPDPGLRGPRTNPEAPGPACPGHPERPGHHDASRPESGSGTAGPPISSRSARAA